MSMTERKHTRGDDGVASGSAGDEAQKGKNNETSSHSHRDGCCFMRCPYVDNVGDNGAF